MTGPSEHRTEEPQSERGAPGSRDTGSDEPSGGPAARPSGTYRGDESVPAHDEHGKPGAAASDTEEYAPSDTKPAVPPYEGRQTSAKPEGGQGQGEGARTGGAVKPQTDSGYKAPPPGETPGGATASPAAEQPAEQASEKQGEGDQVGPSHTPGVGKAEDKR